jgi:phasin
MASSPKKAPPPPARAPEVHAYVEPAPVAPVEPAPVEPAPVVEAAVAVAPTVVNSETPKAVAAPVAAIADLQEKARGLLEKGLSEGRANYAKIKTVADEAGSAFEASVNAAKSGVVEFNVKAIEAFKAGADANFDFVKSLFSAGSVSEFVTLHTEFARKQFETATAQSKEFATLARKVADESVAPIKAQVSKSFKIAV